jgi:hypothetical protein
MTRKSKTPAQFRRYSVDLAKDPSERWQALTGDPWARRQARKLARNFEASLPSAIGWLITRLSKAALDVAGTGDLGYDDEIATWGGRVVSHKALMAAANLSYELLVGSKCTQPPPQRPTNKARQYNTPSTRLSGLFGGVTFILSQILSGQSPENRSDGRRCHCSSKYTTDAHG